ncbi:Transcriptional adapter ada2 [Coemansia biformis]|uniref:Transcriptional adapter 2 n=1 Tax=Coemansia biformis TaxID=1286918 RepID=A0A9W7YH22_9FUNG|nr:Transcriptional adapter ada2 [Coemansia biformis]
MSQADGKRGQSQAPGDEANVTDGVRISCSECLGFDLCTTCFSRGVEIGTHKNDHPYRVVTRHRFPIFTENWSADEELLLIDGLRQFGMGNWKDAAEHVGTKTKEECEQHYLEVYVGSDTWPLPNMGRGFDVEFARAPGERRPRNATPSKTKVLSSQPSNHEIVGYMPGRLEFETEYENEAEQIVKDMVINDDDTAEELELKQTVLRIYNGKLDRRLLRKEFIFDRGLLEYRKNQAIDKKRPKDERDLLTRLRVFARMQTRDDFDEFAAGLLNEQRLRQRIGQLQEWRRNGITTLGEGAQFEDERSQRPSRRATTQRDSAHLLERLQRIAAARAVRESILAAASGPAQQKQPGGRKLASPLDIASAEGVELLAESERELCSRLRVFPRPYLRVKEVLLAEYARAGQLGRRSACGLVKMDERRTRRLYEFFVRSGWIKPPPARDEAVSGPARELVPAQQPPPPSSNTNGTRPVAHEF